jgi:diguanylate cyclase (GGDEF)-like protein
MSETQKARIVIADDDVENARIVEAALKSDGHQTRVVADGEAALHMVKSWTPHVVLLDVAMPKMTGMEVLRKIRSLSQFDYVGVLIVTGNSDLEQIVAGLDAGADDYIVKPYRVDELRARVRACLRTKMLHDSLRRSNKKLEEVTTIDELTSLFNMRFGVKHLLEEVEGARKQKGSLSCIIFDLDKFKDINNKFDYLFGNHVLREVAQLVQSLLKHNSLAARYGGDEFFLILPGHSVKDATELAERIRKSVEAHNFKAGAHSTRVTVSLGISGTQASDDPAMIDARELMRAAVAALQGAKNGGRNRAECFNML